MKAVSIFRILIASLALSLPSMAFSASSCEVKDRSLFVVMFDFQREAHLRKADVRLLVSLGRISTQFQDKQLIRIQFTNFSTDRLNNEARCKIYTHRNFSGSVRTAEGIYSGARAPSHYQAGIATPLSNDFRDLLLSLGQMKVEPETDKTLLIFSNLDYYFEGGIEGRSSRGHYLSDGWVSSSVSPLVNDVLDVETDRFLGTKVFVITDGTDSLSVLQGKRSFFNAFFNHLGAQLFYLGPAFSEFKVEPSLLDHVFMTSLSGEREPYSTNSLGEAELLQIINRTGSSNISSSDLR